MTGASRGIGAAIALALAADGWPVAVNYRSGVDGATATVEAIVSAGGHAVAIQGDVSDPAVPDRLLGAVREQLGPLAVLVNNAGLRADGLALSLSDEDWQRVLDTNLGATYRLTRAVLREMIRARFGRVINIASVIGPRANAGQANYAASKAGLVGMARAIAREVGSRQITVNVVAPGLVATDMTSELGPASDQMAALIPGGRVGEPTDIAGVVGFLASNHARYITGAVLAVDGGLALGL